jgi:hypothetical protein
LKKNLTQLLDDEKNLKQQLDDKKTQIGKCDLDMAKITAEKEGARKEKKKLQLQSRISPDMPQVRISEKGHYSVSRFLTTSIRKLKSMISCLSMPVFLESLK